MPERSDELLREEVRGIFVLGVIGTLLALGRGLDVKVFLDISLADLTNGLVLFWGIYVVVMAVGVSDDVFKSSVAEFCRGFAKFYFLMGLATLMTVPVMDSAYYSLRALGILITWSNVIPFALAWAALVFLFMWLLRKKGSLFS
jgi:hypothetical protein